MVKYFCDRCEKEVPKEEIRQCSLYVRKHKTNLGEIELSYCQECFEEIIGRENAERIKKIEFERDARKKVRAEG